MNVETRERKRGEIEFPCLLKGSDGIIILATDMNDGHSYVGCVVATSIGYELGYSSKIWSVDDFEFYTGSITLSNL